MSRRHVCTHAHAHVCRNAYSHVYEPVCTHFYTRFCAHVRTDLYACLYIFIDVSVYTYTQAFWAKEADKAKEGTEQPEIKKDKKACLKHMSEPMYVRMYRADRGQEGNEGVPSLCAMAIDIFRHMPMHMSVCMSKRVSKPVCNHVPSSTEIKKRRRLAACRQARTKCASMRG